MRYKNVTADRVLKVVTIGGRLDVHPGDTCLVAPEKAAPFLEREELQLIPVKITTTDQNIAKESDS